MLHLPIELNLLGTSDRHCPLFQCIFLMLLLPYNRIYLPIFAADLLLTGNILQAMIIGRNHIIVTMLLLFRRLISSPIGAFYYFLSIPYFFLSFSYNTPFISEIQLSTMISLKAEKRTTILSNYPFAILT